MVLQRLWQGVALMPQRPLQACAVPGCGVRVASGRCAPHAVQLEHTRRNRDVRKWYYIAQWAHLRQQVLTDAAFTCAQCGSVQGDLHVDHIVKHNGDPEVFWNRANLQTLCASCHQRKTARGE
jgi:5-methylcytosine-specific restriction protein A